MRVRNAQDMLSGVFFFGIGAGAVFIAMDYDLGSLRSIGPGAFPIALGVVLIIFGTLLIGRSFVGKLVPFEIPDLKPALLVLSGSLLFALLLRPAGLLVAIVVMVLVGSAANREVNWTEAVLTAVSLALGSALVFSYALGLPLPIIGNWLLAG